MKTCITCKQTKTNDEFPKNVSNKSGYRGQCKDCRNTRQRELKEAKRKRDKQQALMDLAARDNPVRSNVAAPRTYVTAEVWVPQDRTYYRNDGNKHIQSRGV